MNKGKIKETINSKSFRIVIYTILSFAVVFMTFHLGMFAGYKKATFGCNWGRNYMMNFGDPRSRPMPPDKQFEDFKNLPNAHGSIGKIIKISLPNIIVLDEREKTEKVVLIDDKTKIRMAREDAEAGDLRLEDKIIVIGTPNVQGQIEAKLIRLIVAPLEDPFIQD